MKLAIQLACDPNTSIQTILTCASNDSSSSSSSSSPSSSSPYSLSNPENSNLYYSALIANQPPLKNQSAIIGLLLLPCPQLNDVDARTQVGRNMNMNMNMNMENGGMDVSGNDMNAAIGELSAEICKSYLMAVSLRMDCVLNEWNANMLDSRYLNDLLKGIRSAATICAHSNRSFISSSGILLSLAKLAKMMRKHPFLSRNMQDLEGLLMSTMQGQGQSNLENNNPNHLMNNHYHHHQTQAAIDRITEEETKHKHALTPVHVEFLQCCILASQYNIAKTFIDENPIYTIMPKQSSMHDGRSGNKSNHGNDSSGGVVGMHPNLSSPSIVSSVAFLRYHYLLGMVHLACDDYNNAIKAFGICITVPSKVVSAITIEARKKMMLAYCLLLHYEDEKQYDNTGSGSGSGASSNQQKKKQPSSSSSSLSRSESTLEMVSPTSSSFKNDDTNSSNYASPILKKIFTLPNAVSTPVSRYFTGTSSSSMSMGSGSGGDSNNHPMKAYELIVKAFISLNVASFTTIMNDKHDQFVHDGNMGLVKQLLPLIQYRCVRNISSIYEAIPLSKLGQKLGLEKDDDTEALLLKIAMNQQNANVSCSTTTKIDFTIESSDGNGAASVVYFYEVGFQEEKEIGNEHENVQLELSKRVMSSIQLAERIHKMEMDVLCSANYQAILTKENPAEGGGGGGEKSGVGSGGGAAPASARSVISEL